MSLPPVVYRTWRNWAETASCKPSKVWQPTSLEELQAAVRGAGEAGASVRVIGSGHSPSDIACSDEHVICVRRLNRVLSIDRDALTVDVQAGCTLKVLIAKLDEAGMALPLLGSIVEQTIGGALATATHGTGLQFGMLGDGLLSATLVLADGNSLQVDRDSRFMPAVRVHLGALGALYSVRLRIVPQFQVSVVEKRERMSELLPVLRSRAEAVAHFRALYIPHTDCVWTWEASRVTQRDSSVALAEPAERRSSRRRGLLAFLRRLLARFSYWFRWRFIGFHALQFLYACGRWLPAIIPLANKLLAAITYRGQQRSSDVSFRQFTMDCRYKQHVSEWCVPLRNATAALDAVRRLFVDSGGRFRAHLPVELRFQAGDSTSLLSPTGGEPALWIGIIAYKPYNLDVRYRSYFSAFEQAMRTVGGRPHWAKAFHLQADELSDMYAPGWQRFQQLRAELDPTGLFTNKWTKRVLGRVE
eukprot:PLAT12768.1.p1 GENE.PLAT12768.1~~PLAT12768.1.p1  ORF type:complete len:480 (-),score=192.46 PLAT12768.1:29-1447(-)